MPALAPLTAAFAILAFLHPRPVQVHVYQLGRWRLEVRRDTFRGDTQCHVVDARDPLNGTTAGHAALLLGLPGGQDGSEAWYSVDGGPALPWTDVEARLIATGGLARAESLDNATGGHLPLPYDTIAGAKVITVQPQRGSRVQTYRLDRLWSVIAAANRLGCGFETGRAAPNDHPA